MHFCAVWGEADHAAMSALLPSVQVIRCDKRDFPYPRDIAGPKPRAGEVVGIFDLYAFGPDKRDWIARLRRIVALGAGVVIIDRETGERGLMSMEASSAEIMRYTLDGRVRRGKKMAESRWKETQKQRMSDDEARLVWFDQTLSEKTALARMPGWTRATAMVRLGGRKRGEQAAQWAPVAAAEKTARLAKQKVKPAPEVRPARGPRWRKSKSKSRK
jgi:hypothetical protein